MTTHDVTLTFANTMEDLARLPELVETFGQENSLPHRVVFSLSLALDELLTNVIHYGYCDCGHHTISVELRLRENLLKVRILDRGQPFNPLEAAPPELDVPLEHRTKQVGGMGIHLVKHFMDTMEYERRDETNILTLTKQLDEDEKGNTLPKEQQ